MSEEVAKENGDTGLGLSEFLASSPKEEVSETVVTEEPSPETEKVETAEVTETEKTKEEQAVKETVKTEEDAVEAKKEEDVKPEANWDDSKNPYKQRYQDTQKWANNINMQNVELKRQLDIINKKLDGTYDAEAEENANQIKPEEIAYTAETTGKIVSSREAAFTIYGEDLVNKTLFAPDAPFRQIQDLPQVQARVMTSPSPVLEAMKVVREYAFNAKWGNAPEEIEANIKKAYEKELEDVVTKKILEKMKLKEKQPQGLKDARGAQPGGMPAQSGLTPLSEVFGNR